MKRRIVSVVMVLIILLAVGIPATAANYTDLNGHWAKDYMLDLADKGFLTGYSDNTMRPNANITAAETLALLSRFYTFTEEESKFIEADYQAVVTSSVAANYSWAYKNLAVCLAAGIVTEPELKSMQLGVEMKKEQLAVCLVRAMQLTAEAEALSGTVMPFVDNTSIADSARGAVAELVAIKIVGGDDTGHFLPQSSVTRAVAATMVSRALDYLAEQSKTLTVAAYSGLSRREGIITSVGSSVLSIRGYDGLTREYNIPSTVEVTVNGTAKSLNTLYIGCRAVISMKNNAVLKVVISSDETISWVQGVVSSITSSTTYDYLYVKDISAGSVTRYTIPSTATCTKDGVSIDPTSLKDTDFVTIKSVNNVVTSVKVITGPTELSGVISAIDYGTTVTLKITDNTGTKYRFLLNISKLPPISRGGTVISIDRLKVGNAVTVLMARNDITSIVTSGTESTITGELTSISITKNGTVWVVTSDDGTATSLTLDENAGAYSGSQSILLSDISIGDRVAVVVFNNTITEINLITAVSTSDKISVSVLAVDTTNKTITALTPNGKLVYISTSKVISVIDSATGRTVSLTTIKVDSRIVAYGAYTDSSSFAATSIVIE